MLMFGVGSDRLAAINGWQLTMSQARFFDAGSAFVDRVIGAPSLTWLFVGLS